MKTFSPLKFAEHLAKLAATETVALQAGLKKAAKLVEKEAKKEIGHYQPEVGSFPAWAELADSTKEDRVRQGYPENEPLLREGDLRDSYQHEVKGYEAAIGSDSDIAVYHEFGTVKMPARPVLGPAAFKNKEKIRAILGAAAFSGLIGKDKIHESLGYDFNTND
jgi:HK97 gp10 family phage protein